MIRFDENASSCVREALLLVMSHKRKTREEVLKESGIGEFVFDALMRRDARVSKKIANKLSKYFGGSEKFWRSLKRYNKKEV